MKAKLFIACLLTSASCFANWKLTSATTTAPSFIKDPCPNAEVIVQIDSTTSDLQVLGKGDQGNWFTAYQFLNVNKGRTCEHLNSSYIMGGYRCTATTLKNNVYTNGDCDWELGNFKCNPFNTSRAVITTAIISQNQLVLTENNPGSNEAYQNRCVYTQE